MNWLARYLAGEPPEDEAPVEDESLPPRDDFGAMRPDEGDEDVTDTGTGGKRLTDGER